MSILYIIPTPIGNIEDITIRAKRILQETNILFCEDTRVTKKLLSLLEISYNDKQLFSNFEHNERENVAKIIELLEAGNNIGLVTDAGTPLISDPGFPIVREIRKIKNTNIKIEVLPGASSVTVALAGSGLGTDKFTFLGFIPRKPGDRKKLFNGVKASFELIPSTYIFFESHYRILSTLENIQEIVGDQTQVVIAKELTKKFETYTEGSVVEMIELIKNKKINLSGEMVVLFRV